MQWEKDLEAKHAAEIFIWRGRSGNPGLRLIHRLESAENVHGLNRVGSSRVPYVTNRETQTHPIYTHLTYTTGDLHIRPHPQRWTENQGILSENLAAIASQKWGVRDWWTNLLVFDKLCWFFVSTVIYFLLHVLSIHIFGIYFKVLLFPYLFPPSEVPSWVSWGHICVLLILEYSSLSSYSVHSTEYSWNSKDSSC